MYISVRLEPVEDGTQSTKLKGDVFVHALDDQEGMINYVMTKAFGQCWPKGSSAKEIKKEWVSELTSAFPGTNVTISSALHMAMYSKASEVYKGLRNSSSIVDKERFLMGETPEERLEKMRESWAFSY